MLRDLKFFRRNVGKKPENEEIENVPVNPTDSSIIPIVNYANRAPLNSIQQLTPQNPKPVSDHELGIKSKSDRTTPTKKAVNGNVSTSTLRTPEKQVGVSSRNKFGWVQKNDGGVSGNETREDGRLDVTNLQALTRGITGMTPRSVRTVGKTMTNHSETSSTHSTPTKSVSKPPNPGFVSTNSSRPPVNVGQRSGANCAALTKGVPVSCNPPLVLNTVEVPHFDLKEDPSFWMDHNVQVLIRVRPLNTTERSSQGFNRCLKQESAHSIAWIGHPENRFTFDHVACETVNQEMLFRVAGLPMVENCLSGYNSCMFAYGQTGSGKTHTMLGEIADLEVKRSQDRGMTPRIFEFLFARIRAEEESRRDEKLKYNCKCSFLEIYNEQITDLLDPMSTNLLLREDIKNGVYVENLSEYEVQSVNDIIKLLTEGAANRRVAATHMNRESSRSHSVFTCVIESRWEKDSATNLRFARLNLVDLAGSERQKTSGAEGERLKEAANINKSLSTLGHVIMLLVDVAHGRVRHIPYRDSRLTFLLQESLGGNSKTMIIANVSPSICCAAETLSTLKFAQRAKLIQNNAVINEDASGDVSALQHQIQMLKEELSVLKRRNISRSLSFRSTSLGETDGEGLEDSYMETSDMSDNGIDDASQRSASSGIVRVSTKQLKSLEATLAGALRREQMADSSIKQLEAEIEQLNRLVNQREEDTRGTKMMLKFREDKIGRMESLLGGSMPSDAYLLEENTVLSEEIQLLRAKIDRNPEVTRFALENIRLLNKLRRFQDFYEEGEREMLSSEVSELRNQLLRFLDGNNEQYNHLNANTSYEVPYLLASPMMVHVLLDYYDSFSKLSFFSVEKTNEELEQCRNNLNTCLEVNTKLTREIDDLQCQLDNLKSSHQDQDAGVKPVKESLMKVAAVHEQKAKWKHEATMRHTEEVMEMQLQLDILKIMLQEERSSREEAEERALSLSSDLEMAKKRCLEIGRHYEDVEDKLKDSRSVAEALESQQILVISELESLRDRNNHYMELFSEKKQDTSPQREQIYFQELRESSSLKSKDSKLQVKLKKMQDSLEKAKRLNTWYQSDQAFQTSHAQEMDEVRRQVEAETAEVIICLQEELVALQQQVTDSNEKEAETKESVVLLENEVSDLKAKLCLMTQDNIRLNELVQEKDEEIKRLSEEWEVLACEIEEAIADGHGALVDASDQMDLITSCFPSKKWIYEQVGKILRHISEKEATIEELQRSLMEAKNIGSDMDWKLRSLRGAALAITEVQQLDSSEREKEIIKLTSLLSEKSSSISELENIIKTRDDQLTRAEKCATVAFIIINRLSEITSDRDTQLNETMLLNLKKDALVEDQAVAIDGGKQEIQALKRELGVSEETCVLLKQKISEEENCVHLMERKFEHVEKDMTELENRIKIKDEQLARAETCATVAFVIVNRLSEITCDCRDELKKKDNQLAETISLSLKKDALIQEQVAAIDGAESRIQVMKWESDVFEDSCIVLKQKLSEEEKCVHYMNVKLDQVEKDMTVLENKIKIKDDQLTRAETCATVAFVVVNRLSEIISDCRDVLKQKDTQLDETISLNLKKDALIQDQVAAIDGAESNIEALRRELEVSEETCVMLKQKLSEEEKNIHLMEKKIEDVEKDILLKTKEKVDEFKLGVSALNLCVNEYAEQLGGAEKVQMPGNKDSKCVDDCSESRIGSHISQDISCKEPLIIADFKNDETESSFKIGRDVKCFPCELEYASPGGIHKDAYDRDLTILLLRKEIESALISLSGVQAQMFTLLKEKEEISNSEKRYKESTECFATQLLALQTEICSSEEQLKLKISELEFKLLNLEQSTQEAEVSRLQREEAFDFELSDAKAVAFQKTVEVVSLRAKVAEAQETMKEADIMVNALVIASDNSKFEMERLTEERVKLTNERDLLTNEVQSLHFSIDQKNQLFANLEKQFLSDLSDTRSLVSTLEDIVIEIQTSFTEQFESLLSDFHCFKSQVLHSTSLTWSWLEDIWSDIVVKDCAVSALHLCHMGVLLEAVNGLNAENGLLHHGVCESDSVIRDLKEHNFKISKELEMFGNVKGKLLVDIKNSFDRISRKEDEAGNLSRKLSSFGEKILDLQLQEESMLARSVSMGSELSRITDELDLHKTSALTALSDQLKLLTDKESVMSSQVEFLTIDLTAKDFQSLILESELLQMALQNADLASERMALSASHEVIKKEFVLLSVEADLEKQLLLDTEVEVLFLKEVVEEISIERSCITQKLEQCSARLWEVEEEKQALEQDIQSLKENACLNNNLKSELAELREAKERLTAKLESLETQTSLHIKDGVTKEAALKASICELETDLDLKDAKINSLCSTEMENEGLRNEVRKLKADCYKGSDDFQEKKFELEVSYCLMDGLGQENQVLQETICSMEDCIAILQSDCDTKNRKLEELQHSQSIFVKDLSSLKEENDSLRNKLMFVKQNSESLCSVVSSNVKHCVDSVQVVDTTQNRILQVLDVKNITLLDKMFHEICENKERAIDLMKECDILESFIEELTQENISFRAELLRKDEVLNGLLFDLSLLQESASNAKDQKDEVEELMATVESLEYDLAMRSAELDESIGHNQRLEAQMQLEAQNSESLKLVLDENVELKTELEEVLLVQGCIEHELNEKEKALESLEEDRYQMDNALDQMNTFLEGLKNDLNMVTVERDQLKSEVCTLNDRLETTQALAEENEARAMEALQIAETRKAYAEDKEEEVKLLERSVEELESTVSVLENKVDIVKGEAERQRLLREELETSPSTTSDISSDLQEAQEQIRILEKNLADKDAEISQCRAYISELNLHAEAQAHEYKKKFKELEAMAEQVKSDPSPSHTTNSSSTKVEKNAAKSRGSGSPYAAKSRGSGSPFKCIGLGMGHQINSEKDEELAAGRHRIEELEALAATRQKEIFMLNAKLAAAESMTHDVIRDLLGVKLDMTNYASLLDHQQANRITDKARLLQTEESETITKLKQQLNEFVLERQSWQSEMVSAQITTEKLHQRHHLLTTENDMLKKENVGHKKKVIELEDEVKKLSGQQNLQQRIHHHAKIKEENNLLRVQNEELSVKLRRLENIVSRLKEEIARYRCKDNFALD